MGKGLARCGIDSLGASPQRFLDQRSAKAAIGPGNQNCFVSGLHNFSSINGLCRTFVAAQ
jgi:hypothetical protein